MSALLAEAMQEAYQSVKREGYGCFSASVMRLFLGPAAIEQLPQVLESFQSLGLDPHMGDGGTYRLRAYNRYRVPSLAAPLRAHLLDDHSIFQAAEDNRVNGGVRRTFAPLADDIASGPFLQALVENAATQATNYDPSLRSGPFVVGVHQVRIVARSEVPGLPTPEGIHRDRERFTFQHFMARRGIEGGEFRAHNESKEVVFSWLQEDCLDTVMFEGTTWHSATPIQCAATGVEGYRDIFLVDVDPE